MPNISAWSESQPVALGELIAYKPTSITVSRNGTSLAAQTVRLETLSGDKQIMGTGGVVHQISAMALGYKGHPTIADTNLLPGDLFTANSVHYEVIAVMPAHTDCLQAYLKVRA